VITFAFAIAATGNEVAGEMIKGQNVYDNITGEQIEVGDSMALSI
jgi:hypothetical protein